LYISFFKTIMLPVLVYLFLGALSQTIYPERHFGKLFVANDGRIETLIDSNDAYWMTSYRQFIELDTDTGELMVAFNVGQSEYPTIEAMGNDAHIMVTTLAKGSSSWSEPTNATVNAEGYIHGNMVLWYDTMKQQMVMVYQSSRTTKTEEDGFDIKLNLIRRDSGGTTWSKRQDFLDEIENPHIRYQFIESTTTNPEGYAEKLVIPVYHLAASDADDNFDTSDNYEQVVIISRNLYADSEYAVRSMEKTSGSSEGYFQASIVRVPSEDHTGDNNDETQLVAFLRDSEGYWLYRSTSDDDGYTWTDPGMTAIPNPDQTAQAIYLHSGLLMMIYNPSQSMTSEPSAGDVYSNCHHLAVGLSSDYGLTWQFSRMLEYAYDGMFNNPVGLQDPNCNNIYLTYSVITDETNGCSMLDQCDEATQGTLSYIKFTIISEHWVMNDFNYEYDADNCGWVIPDQMLMVSTATFNSLVSTSSTELNIVIILSIAVAAFALLNIGLCYWSVYRKRDYADLEASQQANDPNDYETTK